MDTLITGDAYRTYRPLLFSVLARLARQGFVVPPSYIMDIIQDFFLDEWPKVIARYDPARSELPSYVYLCFTRYARKKIMQLQRMESIGLLNLRAMTREAILNGLESDEGIDDPGDRELVRQAIHELEDVRRRILLDFLNGNSLRTIAASLSISRYKALESLYEAILAVVVKIDTPWGISERDWSISRAIYERCPVRRIVASMGISRQCVEAVHDANMKLLVSRLVSNSRSAVRIGNHKLLEVQGDESVSTRAA